MASISQCFKINFVFLKLFGLWPGKHVTRLYKCYSVIFIFISLFAYNCLLILNLVYTPRKIALMIPEVIFFFTDVAVTAKVFMILRMRKKLFVVFDILDCKHFLGEDDVSRQIVNGHVSKYRTCWKIYAILCNSAYFSHVFLPIIAHFIFKTNLELPICKYYFLNANVVRKYFVLWFVYQFIGMYGHMTYNINVDTLMSGLIYMGIAQLRVLNHKFKNLKTYNEDSEISKEHVDEKQIIKLNNCLRHYEILLKYCTIIQEIINLTMFIQFSVASMVICVVLSALTLPSTTEFLVFMICYLVAMLSQIFVPAWLGTQLIYENQDLVFAAYCSEWIPRSKRFTSNVKLFAQRANVKLRLTACGLFPLSLDSFLSILKTAYSFFTLIHNFQDSN